SHVAGISGEEIARLEADVVSPDACAATLGVRKRHPPSVLADRSAGDPGSDHAADAVCRKAVERAVRLEVDVPQTCRQGGRPRSLEIQRLRSLTRRVSDPFA